MQMESDKITAARASGRVKQYGMPSTIQSFNVYTSGRQYNRSSDYQKFQAYNAYLDTGLNRGDINKEQHIGVLANLPEGMSDPSNAKDSYDTWLRTLNFPDTEQTRQHFSDLIGDEAWVLGMKATIDSAIGTTMMQINKDKRQKNKDSARFGFK